MRNKRNGKIRFGCVTSFLLFLVVVFVYTDYMGYAKRKMVYTHSVWRYLAQEKRKNGKWPTDLRVFSQRSSFHRQNYQSMEIVQSDDKSCRFRLHLRGFWGFYPSRSVVEEETARIK